ncbi:MAG: zinc-binding protein [Firmicutes bacterium HGW-Firmicutes-15]|nr:MAG: zinc-binding protein [Firmicutes bacterium HGW-Firmicutes-15]
MNETCCSNSTNMVVVACSGASNLGQISNGIAVRIQQQGIGQMTCLAAIGAHVDSYIKSAIDADLIVIDGCAVACAKRTIEHVGISDFRYFDISGVLPDVVKGKKYDQVEFESEKALEIIMEQIK